MVGAFGVPQLAPGEDYIFTFEWYIQENTGVGTDWASCLLARIEDSTADPITVYPDHLEWDIYYNNNVSLRNCIVTNYEENTGSSLSFLVGNYLDHNEHFDIVLKDSEQDGSQRVSEAAEVTLEFDEVGWNLIQNQINNNPNLRISNTNKSFTYSDADVSLNNINFPAQTRIPVRVKYNFLTDRITDKNQFNFSVVQKYSTPHPELGDHWVGGMHFVVKKSSRDLFDANAGDDKEIDADETITISAAQINEAAVYNWYDMDGNLIYTGETLTVSPEVTKRYQLEVIANVDGFKDFDEVEVVVKPYSLEALIPNPASDQVVVSYKTQSVNSAYLMIIGTNNSTSNNYILDTSEMEINIDISGYPVGFYTVALVCNGEIVDAKTLIKE